MATIAQLEATLLDAASQSNMTLIKSTINSLTSTQKNSINPAVYDTVLYSIANYTYEDDSVATSTVLAFMKKVGTKVHGDVIGNALRSFADDQNYAAMDAATDYLTSAQKADMNAHGSLNDVVDTLARLTYLSPNDTTLNTALRDFMSKVGTYVHGDVLGAALRYFADDQNYAAMDAATDYLTATQKADMNAHGSLNDVVDTLARLTYLSPNDTTLNTALRDFMSKVGTYVHGDALGLALRYFADDQNYAAMDAATDYLVTAQKADMNAYGSLDHVVDILARSTYFSPNDTTLNAALRDFMSKLGTYVHGDVLGAALRYFADDQNYAAMDAATDYLTATQKADMNAYGDLDHVVDILARSTYFSPNDTTLNAALRDFMSKLGTYVHGDALGLALRSFADDQNYAAMDAATDYLTSAQKADMNAYGDLDEVVDTLSQSTYFSPDDTTLNAALRDFMSKVGTYAHSDVIDSALYRFADDQNHGGVDAMLGSISSSQFSALTSSTKTFLSNTGHKLGTFGTDTINGAAGDERIYGLDGGDTLYGNAGNDILLGGAGSDKLYGGTGADIFKFQANNGNDTIKDFKLADGDKLDFHDILMGYDPLESAITDFVKITNSTGKSIVKVDIDGRGSAFGWTQVATIEGVTDLTNEASLQNSGTIIA